MCYFMDIYLRDGEGRLWIHILMAGKTLFFNGLLYKLVLEWSYGNGALYRLAREGDSG